MPLYAPLYAEVEVAVATEMRQGLIGPGAQLAPEDLLVERRQQDHDPHEFTGFVEDARALGPQASAATRSGL